MKATKSDEIRARVQPLIKFALDKQAELEHLQPPDILRKALWDYLARVNSPFIVTTTSTDAARNQRL